MLGQFIYCSRPMRACLAWVCCRCWVGLDVEQEAPSTSWSCKNPRQKMCCSVYYTHLWVTKWRMFQYCWKERVWAGRNKQPRVFGKAFWCKVQWGYTLSWKFGQTGRIKTLKHQIWRECGTGCWGDSSVVLPHVFPSAGFCDYMWLPHSL